MLNMQERVGIRHATKLIKQCSRFSLVGDGGYIAFGAYIRHIANVIIKQMMNRITLIKRFPIGNTSFLCWLQGSTNGGVDGTNTLLRDYFSMI